MSTKYKFYNKEGLYFTSTAVVGWTGEFTRREYNNILIDSLKYCQAEKGLEIFAWCLMSNHFHLVCRAKENYLLQDIFRDFKKFTSKELLKAIAENDQESRQERWLALFARAGKYNSNNSKYQFWRQDNHPKELLSNEVIDQKIDYIHNNPVEAGMVDNPEEYIYSSARDYVGAKGLVDLDIEY